MGEPTDLRMLPPPPPNSRNLPSDAAGALVFANNLALVRGKLVSKPGVDLELLPEFAPFGANASFTD